MTVRCDKPMRMRKEKARTMDGFSVPKWTCRGDCYNCICGIVKEKDGTEHHVSFMKGEKNAQIHDTADAGNEEEQQSDHSQQGDRTTDGHSE